MKKIFFSLVVLALILLSVLAVKTCTQEHDMVPADAAVPAPTATASPAPTPQITRLSFSATGDNLIHNGIYEQAQSRAARQEKEGYDFSYCYQNVREFYSSFDINWLNQETIVNDELEPSTYPCFSTPGQMGKELYDLGFRIFNMSNNHAYDKGKPGIEATQRFWTNMPSDIITAGLYDSGNPQISYQQIDGIIIAYLSFTEHTNGLPHPADSKVQVIYTSQRELMEQLVRQADENADLVITGVHWGVEGSHGITDNQKSLAQDLANWGTDVIIGTGPHVIQNAEWLSREADDNSFVAYSLGNFLNAQSNADCMIGAVLTFDIVSTLGLDGNRETHIENPFLIPTVNHYERNYSNIRIYMRSDYTEELAHSHGVQSQMPGFSLSYIDKVIDTNISPDFLK